jgi:hypothetical protein
MLFQIHVTGLKFSKDFFEYRKYFIRQSGNQVVKMWYSGTLRICDIISSQAKIRKLFNLSSQCLTRKLNMIKQGFFLNKWNSVRETTISNSGKLRNYFNCFNGKTSAYYYKIYVFQTAIVKGRNRKFGLQEQFLV